MAVGFYTVYALRAWAAPAVAGGGVHRAAGGRNGRRHAGLAWLADHAGHRLVILGGMAATLGANVMALASPTLSAYGLVFVLAGIQQAALSVSNMPVLLEFAPSDDERPIYMGLGATSLAPVAFAAPLVAGLLADALGFRAVFVVAIVGSAGRPDDAGRTRSRSAARRGGARGGVARVKAVLLDLDDTLLDYSGGAEQCWAAGVRRRRRRARPDGAAGRARPRSAAGSGAIPSVTGASAPT